MIPIHIELLILLFIYLNNRILTTDRLICSIRIIIQMESQKQLLFLILFIAFACAANTGYTLELDWSTTAPTSVSQIGYVTWNQQTLISLTTQNNNGH